MLNKMTKPVAVLLLWHGTLLAQTTFIKITDGAIVNDGGNSRGACWGDYDNDGNIDLFVANDGGENNFLYRNSGNLDGSGQVIFTRITTGPIVEDGGDSKSCTWGDYDNDGDLDLFVANFGEDNFLYRNDGTNHNWVNIKCVGTFSNAAAIGTRVKVKAMLSGETDTANARNLGSDWLLLTKQPGGGVRLKGCDGS